ncbi:MAG: CinA family protein [Alphaproteobacteria bacterium]|nr:CinA family protein [Alphaproteobacteria bacterium]
MQDLVKALFKQLEAHGEKLACAESCTGGLLAAALTDVPGASGFFDRGFVTYSNEAKTEMLGVPEATLSAHGAVSAETAQAMAEGALKNSRAAIAVSITGIAGPDGASAEKPVGLVWFGYAYARGNLLKTEHRLFSGDRRAIRAQSAQTALTGLLSILEDNP